MKRALKTTAIATLCSVMGLTGITLLARTTIANAESPGAVELASDYDQDADDGNETDDDETDDDASDGYDQDADDDNETDDDETAAAISTEPLNGVTDGHTGERLAVETEGDDH